ncbi:urease accessory protein UreD [Saccharopolyspora rhizosphaerae]|uniref:Urease accessory protein UreD n=1 Tax=Saccharopolyspora rhizosphaerae TaxID=2492662 RepID=A0A3R8NY03_9PSEU|nr:urease accessory protein UreD [Saccharopolyspora rhizosphaerae]RRO15375.1 urease accessory protein UreD [Saccharopolyspora rhizosphaerae]
MKATALLAVEVSGGRSVVRDLRSQAPLTLVPRRTATASGGAAVVHLVSSAASPVGGDRVDLRVRVGPGARLRLVGTAATVALPGRGSSRSTVHIEVDEGGTVQYLPETTVISSRADHAAELTVELAAGARARCRESLVRGRCGEPSGHLVATTQVTRSGKPLLRQRIDLGDARTAASPGYLAGARVLASEVVAWDRDPPGPLSGQWWSLAPLAAGGALATALADDAVTAGHRLAEALSHHPDVEDLLVPTW